MDILKKTATAIGIIIAIWAICPLPEISIIVGIFGGESINRMMGVPRWLTYTTTVAGAIIGTLVLRHYGVIEWARSRLFSSRKEWMQKPHK